jgi:hypothetical protein
MFVGHRYLSVDEFHRRLQVRIDKACRRALASGSTAEIDQLYKELTRLHNGRGWFARYRTALKLGYLNLKHTLKLGD